MNLLLVAAKLIRKSNLKLLAVLLFLSLGRASVYGEAQPLPAVTDPLAGMGVNIHFTDAKPGDLEMLAQAGFRWIRMDLFWAATEKARGVYDFSAYDRLLASLDKFHIRAVFILDYTNGLYDKLAPHTDDDRAAFARWAVAAVTHFKGRGVIWEIWNEPNGSWFWKPTVNADDYAKLTLTASQAIRQAAPDELIVGPALSGTDMKFVDVVAKTGVLASWSGITLHPYRRTGPETVGPAYNQAREFIKKYASPGQRIDVMCGEWGYSTAWPQINETTQARYLARLLLFDVMSGVPLTIWYDWHDDGPKRNDQESNFGIVHHEYHSGGTQVYDPKPSYDAAQTYSRELKDFRFKERLKTASGDDFVLSFTKDGTECLVAWTTAPTPHPIKIPLPDGEYTATSYDGKSQTEVTASAGVAALQLDGGPQYLKRK